MLQLDCSVSYINAVAYYYELQRLLAVPEYNPYHELDCQTEAKQRAFSVIPEVLQLIQAGHLHDRLDLEPAELAQLLHDERA